jgi:hypothetical protein
VRHGGKGIFAGGVGLCVAWFMLLQFSDPFLEGRPGWFVILAVVVLPIACAMVFSTASRLLRQSFAIAPQFLGWGLPAIILAGAVWGGIFSHVAPGLTARYFGRRAHRSPSAWYEAHAAAQQGAWGARYDVFVLHPVWDGPANTQLTIQLSPLLRLLSLHQFFGSMLHAVVTQPVTAVLDAEGHPRQSDGVRLLFMARNASREALLRTFDLPSLARDATQRHWHRVPVKLPAWATSLEVRALPGPPGSTTFHDTTFIHIDDVSYGILGAQAGLGILRAFCLFVVGCWLWRLLEQRRRKFPSPPLLRFPSVNTSRLVFWLVLLVFANLLAVYVIHYEKTVYYWDYVGYWRKCSHQAETLFTEPLAELRSVWGSIQHDDYNSVACLPISPLLAVFGDSHLIYILALVNVYALLALASCAAAGRLIGNVWLRGASGQNGWYAWSIGATLLFLPHFWVPVLDGYIGVGGISFAAIAYICYFVYLKERDDLLTLVPVTLCLLLLVIFRRWYAYWVVAFLCMAGLDSLMSLAMQRTWRLSAFGKALQRPLIITISFTVGMVAFFSPLLSRMLRVDYAFLYSAYKFFDRFTELKSILVAFGFIPMLLLIISIGFLCWNATTRRFAGLLTLHMVITFFLITRVQNHGVHHYYLYYPSLLLLMGGFTAYTFSVLRRPLMWRLLGLVYLSLGTLCTLNTFSPSVANWSRSWSAEAFPGLHRFPLVRHDLPELLRLASYLDDRVADEPGAKVYVVASSKLFTADILRYLEVSLGLPAPHGNRQYVLPTHHVDRRDGFPSPLLEADYVLVASPIQYHLRPEDQQVVGLPAASFLQGQNIARAFARQPEEFHLDQGVTVFVYRKVRPVKPEEIAELHECLQGSSSARIGR